MSNSLDPMLATVRSLEESIAIWPDDFRQTALAHARAIDDLNAEAFRRLIKTLNACPETATLLRDAVADELVYAVLRRHEILKPSLYERVQSALDTIRPTLASHGGNVELVAVEPPVAEIRFLGACDGCPASSLTFYAGVKQAIVDHVPQITDIRQVKGLSQETQVINFTSPFANNREGNWIPALSLDAIAEGETQSVVVAGHPVLISRFPGNKLTCYENACAHMGMPMDGGEIADGYITCPHHGFTYSLESGECLTAPDVHLQVHGVKVMGDRVDVRLTP